MRRKLIDADEFTSELAKAYAEQSKTAGTWERLITTQLLASFSKDVTEVINKLPTVDIEPHWIPCCERLPEAPFGCLVTVEDEEPMTGALFPNLLPYFVGWDGEQWNDADGEQCPFEVLAWMPLPKPYEVEDE